MRRSLDLTIQRIISNAWLLAKIKNEALCDQSCIRTALSHVGALSHHDR